MRQPVDTNRKVEKNEMVLGTVQHNSIYMPSSLLDLPVQVFTYTHELPLTLLSFRLNSPSLSQHSQDRCSSPFNIFVALHCTRSSSSISFFVQGSPELDPALQMWPHQY